MAEGLDRVPLKTPSEARTRDFLEGGPKGQKGWSRKCESGKEMMPPKGIC